MKAIKKDFVLPAGYSASNYFLGLSICPGARNTLYFFVSGGGDQGLLFEAFDQTAKQSNIALKEFKLLEPNGFERPGSFDFCMSVESFKNIEQFESFLKGLGFSNDADFKPGTFAYSYHRASVLGEVGVQESTGEPIMCSCRDYLAKRFLVLNSSASLGVSSSPLFADHGQPAASATPGGSSPQPGAQ